MRKNNDIYHDNGIITETKRFINYNECGLIANKFISIFANDKGMDIQLKIKIFNNVLNKIDDDIQDDIRQELVLLYKNVITGNESIKTPPNLSMSTLNYLELKLCYYPALVHWLISELLCIWSTTFINTDSSLQDIYLNIFKKSNILLSNESSIDYNFINNINNGVLFCILSKIELTETKENELLTWICPVLFKYGKFKDTELALYSRKNLKYFNIWHDYLNGICGRKIKPDNIDNALKISKSIFNDNKLNSSEILIRINKTKTHWLDDILDVYLMMTKENKINETNMILSCPVLPDLSIILLLKLMNDCSNIDISVLKLLHNYCKFNNCKDKTIIKIDKIISNQLEALEWIIQSSSNKKITIKKVLHQLQTSTVLSVLKKFVDLNDKDYDKINSLIIDCNDSSIIYQSYCAMICAFNAILLCESYTIEFENIAELYRQMEKYLNTLLPLDMRLEIIENIFTMLFMRHEDFIENENISDCGDDDDDEDDNTTNKKNENTLKYSTGFICNKYAIRETIHYLSRCIYVANNDLNENDNYDLNNQRILTLKNYLNEAIWRLELLTSNEFFKRQGLPNNETQVPRTPTTTSSSSSYFGKIFYKYNDESSDDDNIDVKSDIDMSSESSSLNNNNKTDNITNKKRRQLKKINLTNDINGKDIKDLKESTLNYMLATKETLVLRCLWKNNYAEAQNIIKLFNMDNTSLAGEIDFSRAMQTFRLNINKQLTITNLSNSQTKTQTRRSTIEMIRKAAKDGMEASRTTNQVETFLASQESNINLCSDKKNLKELMTLTSIDLALTISRDYSTTDNLFEVAMKYLNSCDYLKNSTYYEFFQLIYQLHYENKDKLLINDIICDSKIPLSIKELKDKNKYWQELSDKLKLFENNTKIIDSIDNDNCKKQLDDILIICNNDEPYLARLIEHLNILRTLSPKLNNETDKNNKPNNSLLKNSLDFYIGHQIFNLNVDLEELEIIANKLQVNLVHSILVNCCPKLICQNDANNNDNKNNKKWGIIILNKIEKNEKLNEYNFDDPNQCVIDILDELLKFLRNYFNNKSIIHYSELNKLSKNINIIDILKKTKRLENLDLSDLSFGNHTLAFFLNVWNLLMLHTMIKIWSFEPLENKLRHVISTQTIGYKIGDLGLVTLSSLRIKLLGKDICNSEFWFDSYGDELNEPAWQDLDLQYDKRIIFSMLNEYKKSPIVNIYYPETLNETLNSSFHNYINFYNENNNDEEENILTLPIFLSSSETLIKQYYTNIIVKFESINYSCGIKLNYIDENNNEVNQMDNKFDNENTITWKNKNINSKLLQYLDRHCWLLSYLVQKIHNNLPSIENKNNDKRRTSVIDKLFNSAWNKYLKILFNDNSIITSLQKYISINDLWYCFENYLNDKKYLKCLDLINSLFDSYLLNNIEIQKFHDKLLTQIIINLNNNSTDILVYLYQIHDEYILTQLIFKKIKEWPVRICEDALRHVLSHKNKLNIPNHCLNEMSELLCRVMVFDKILPYCKIDNHDDNNDDNNDVIMNNKNWYNIVYKTEKTDPMRIVKSLIDAKQYELCLEWLEYQTITIEALSLVSCDLLIGLLKNEKDNFKQAQKLLCALPNGQSIKFCNNVIDKLESMNALRFIITYLIDNTPDNDIYKKCLIGVDILDKIDNTERKNYIHIINEPILMLEQLLMNCKFDYLHVLLIPTIDKLKLSGFSTIEKFDEIIRFYAKKSLDLRVTTQQQQQQRDGNHIDASIKRDIMINQTNEFIMPINIPTRDEWIPNDKSRECSCCKIVIFSMFNRRHHCRRCGRVVCATCSNQRMRLLNYNTSVYVRVCIDCKRQTAIQQQSQQQQASQQSQQTSIISSDNFDYWKLSYDETNNKIIREEFCFEYSPNISLCLAILNLHSDHESYANFLQDCCDEMKCLLHPDSTGKINPEVDHMLIIKMIKSLLVAAKVKYSILGLNTGLAHCDRFLSQVDLISTLVESDCLSLIPRDDIDDHVLRRLRDLLTEKEQWSLALDVSTKSGLDTQCVWAAWGKASLKVGYYDIARDKFSRCLDKIQQDINIDDWVILSCPKDNINYKKINNNCNNNDDNDINKSKSLKNRPNKDPPLLIEILQILEMLNSNEQYTKNHQQQKTTSSSSSTTAQEIINNLSNIKAICHGNYTIQKLNTNLKNQRYQESLYYLLMYGSFNSILEFFIKYEEYDKCLSYIIENDIDNEIFFNSVFMNCLKNGKITYLFDNMKKKDDTLLLWKKYLIFICHCLDKKQMYHTLYQLQLFMKDYIRSAMTCIRFYVTDANNYIDICTRTHYLNDAQLHLETELHMNTFCKKRRKSTTSNSSINNNNNSLTMEMEPSEIDKHINTISRQMEIAKFLSSCEKEGRSVGDYLSKLSFMECEGLQPRSVPTLFGNQQERTHLAVLSILCGRNVEEGFGIAFRIMQDYCLRSQKVYSLVGHILAMEKRITSIEQLIKCCRSSGAPNSIEISDYVLAHCVKLLLDKTINDNNNNGQYKIDEIDNLIRIIIDVELKISSYIESRQLKAAYLLAVKYSRNKDIKKILREADRLGQHAIMSICNKWLKQNQKN
ncbi:hypothetical protein HCN44_002685 [Aphidius gifuensis]|uniref:FYVE-type domain-containing protein n=2 Tax=Aphidius gifuensis TaxID=684658 RepID=A0A834XPN4_APHGI|nr:hypothetical protein HCN44_002685 [Aphidius gifuensis]